jgi:hypothetical protein
VEWLQQPIQVCKSNVFAIKKKIDISNEKYLSIYTQHMTNKKKRVMVMFTKSENKNDKKESPPFITKPITPWFLKKNKV